MKILISLACALLFTALTVHAEGTQVHVYNHDTRVQLENTPFIHNGDFFLPLRETLAAFGITGITWDDGLIGVALGTDVVPARDLTVTRVLSAYFNVGHYTVTLREDIAHSGRDAHIFTDGTQQNNINLRNSPILKYGVTFMPLDFFEALQGQGHITGLTIYSPTSRNPRDFIIPGEPYFIGTGYQQQAHFPTDSYGNEVLVHRIVVDDNNSVIAIVTVDNQQQGAIASAYSRILGRRVPSGAVFHNGFERVGTTGIRGRSHYIFIQTRRWGHENWYMQTIAIIPPAYQIAIPTQNML
jgi:hypothetical protein